MRTAAISLVLATAFSAQAQDAARWKAEASRVTITRDDWGIAHIHGHSDADAVFGMIYAQCEDDFNRVESNYLTSLGRTAEAVGESGLWADLRQRLFLDPEVLKQDYTQSPEWLRKLMDAWADGINFYLSTHPQTHPKVLTHFDPWMALSFTEGSIGGDIEKVNLRALQDFYSQPSATASITSSPLLSFRSEAEEPAVSTVDAENEEREPSGSNGIAIAASHTKNGHALLLINPHTSFFFRSELQMSSDEGLNAYGAVTWGQFFLYQGFNERAGWMHTTSNVDAVDEFEETVMPLPSDAGVYPIGTRYGDRDPVVTEQSIIITYKTDQGMGQRTFVTKTTVHGPVIRKDGDKWVAIKLMNTPIKALEQSYLRTKAHTYAEYQKTMELMANSSNNTVFADSDGDIAYWHGNFIPKRDPRFDYTKPVDGSDPATDWHGLTPLAEIPQLHNPASGWLFNVNDSPWNGAGPSSLKKSDYPAYVEQGLESARGVHALRVLTAGKDWTPETLRAAAFDSYLPWFAKTVPALLRAYDALPADDPRRAKASASIELKEVPLTDPRRSGMQDEIELLRKWDYRWSAESEATSLAVYWGTEINRVAAAAARRTGVPSEEYVAQKVSADELLNTLVMATGKLYNDFGSWHVPWGQINRFQRITPDIFQPFTDTGPSIPVPFVSSTWGSLASFGARQYPGTNKWYGTSGNSFVAIVEFGPRVHAIAVTAGGESGDPTSKHFTDEAQRYSTGNLREVYFYPDQLKGHTEKTYSPGN